MEDSNQKVLADATQVLAQGVLTGNRANVIEGIRKLVEFLRSVDLDQIKVVLDEVLRVIELLVGPSSQSLEFVLDDDTINEGIKAAALPGPVAQMNLGALISIIQTIVKIIGMFKSLTGTIEESVIRAAGEACCQGSDEPVSCEVEIPAQDADEEVSDDVASDDETE